MNYWQHVEANLGIAGKALTLAFFHTLHAFLPFKWTSHHYWGIYLGKPKSNPYKKA